MDIQTARDVIYLASCAVNEEIPDRLRVRDMDLNMVYTLARCHMISAAVAMALESAGYKDDRSDQLIAKAQRRAIIFQNALSGVKQELEKAGIWFLPLKGIVLKDFYPRYGMREYADHDILFDASRAQDVRDIMEGLGFSTEHFGSSTHDVYHKPPILNFEMHTALFGPEHDENLYNYYRDVESRLIESNHGKNDLSGEKVRPGYDENDSLHGKNDSSGEKVRPECYEKTMSPEDYYLYHLAHEYKHYSGSGTGLRSLLDTYVYLKACKLDKDYIHTEAGKLGLIDFERKNRTLSMNLFGKGECKENDLDMLSYILNSGTYGTIIHRVENTMEKKKWNKLQYMLHRFSVPVSKNSKNYNAYAAAYPFFYKYKILLPILPFYRTIRAAIAGRFKYEARAIRKARRKTRRSEKT